MIAYVSDVHENEQANKLFVPLEMFPPQARVERMAYLEGHILLNVLKQNLVAVAEGVLCPRILNFTMNARLFAQCLSFRLITPQRFPSKFFASFPGVLTCIWPRSNHELRLRREVVFGYVRIQILLDRLDIRFDVR